MLNTSLIIKRLEQVMRHHELSSSSFADRIKVQRSSISHILNGRNKPSLEFVIKVNDSFEDVDLNWLLYGNGYFPHSANMAQNTSEKKFNASTKTNNMKASKEKQIEKVVFFFKDGTFKTYTEDEK